jgi:hypothetical protein
VAGISWRIVAVVVVFSTCAAGCAPPPSPPQYYRPGWCAPDHHTEAYPRNPHRKRAYGCKSDQDGFLEGHGQGDKQGN